MRSFGGELNDTANYLVSLEDGGFVGIGTTESSFPDNPNHGKNDILLAGFDSNGYKIWQKVFGGSENDYGESLIPTADGGFLILGVTESSDALADSFKLQHFGKKDIWVIKTNAFGVVQWTKTYGGTGDDLGKGITKSSDSNSYIICGKSDSINGDFGYLENYGNFDGIIFDVNSDGGEVLKKIRLGGSLDDEIIKVIQGDNRVFFGNTVSSEIQFWHAGYELSGDPKSDIWVGVLDNNNSGVLFQRCLGGTGNEIFSDSVKIPGGNSDFLILSSSESKNGDLTTVSKVFVEEPNYFWWIANVKLYGLSETANFIINWQFTKNPGLINDNAYAKSVAAFSDGFIFAGITVAEGLLDIRNTSNWFLKIDLSGREIWTDKYRNVFPTELKNITKLYGTNKIIGFGDILFERDSIEKSGVKSVDDGDWALLLMR